VTERPAEKNGTGEERHDLEPLTSRFPELGDVQSAVWFSGRLGDERAPGPSSYWIDAVVTISPTETRRLLATYGPETAGTEPAVVEDLEPHLPTGELVTSEQLNRAFSTSGFSTSVWVDEASHRIVLSAVGQGD
jgi:hypothetical protein